MYILDINIEKNYPPHELLPETLNTSPLWDIICQLSSAQPQLMGIGHLYSILCILCEVKGLAAGFAHRWSTVVVGGCRS